MKKSKLIASLMCAFAAMLSFVQAPVAQHQTDRLGARTTRAGARDDRPIVLTANLVSLTVNVLDASGHSVSGLDKSAFTVLDEQVPQEISYFSNEDSPVSVAIVFDVSSSMNEAKLQSAKQALAQFIQTSHQDDEYFLISFASTPKLLLNGVRNGEAVLKKFTYVQAQGNTALYDAVYLGVEKLSQSRFAKRAMILISDGEDNHSLYTFNELRHRLQESDIAIYTVQVGIPLPRSGAWDLMGELASATGGKAFSGDSREGMRRSFEQIALELRRQYSLAFFPSGFQADGRKHQLKVQVSPVAGVRRLVVRYRKSYTTFR